MDDIICRAARRDEMAAAAELRWRWLSENRDVAVADHAEYLAFFEEWAAGHPRHECYVVARGDRLVGMAWLALVDRVPSPTRLGRQSGDVQSVYIVPEERSTGHGARLLGVVLARADELELSHVTVHSSDGAVTFYERAGFAQGAAYLVRTPRSRQSHVRHG